MGKILCFFGWHSFTWKFDRERPFDPFAPPPNHAKCERCGVNYG